MIRLWAKTVTEDKIKKDIIYESRENLTFDTFFDHLSEVCYLLSIPTPVILKDHYNHLQTFNNVKFLPRDFVELVDFDQFVIENALI